MFFSQKWAFRYKNVGAVSLLHFGRFCDILLAGGETMRYRIYDLSVRAISSWLNWWHAKKARNIGIFCYPNLEKFTSIFIDDIGLFYPCVRIWTLKRADSVPFKGRNTVKSRFSRQKIVYKVSDLVLVVFTKYENTGIESFFVSPKTKW